jgi:hypothetical protein
MKTLQAELKDHFKMLEAQFGDMLEIAEKAGKSVEWHEIHVRRVKAVYTEKGNFLEIRIDMPHKPERFIFAPGKRLKVHHDGN